MEGCPDGGPVALEVSPGQEAAGGVGGDRGEDGVDILTPHLAGVQAHRQVPAQGARGQYSCQRTFAKFYSAQKRLLLGPSSPC